jgi:hypothetical protein
MEDIKNMWDITTIFGIDPDYVRMTNVPNRVIMPHIFMITPLFGTS